MEAFEDILTFIAGVPAVVGLILAAVAIVVTSDWRLSLTALLAEYVLLGLALTRFIQAEVAIVRILLGALVVPILYLTARQVQDHRDRQGEGEQGPRFLGLPMSWAAGPLGLPLRLLVVLLTALALIRFFPNYTGLLPVLAVGQAGVSPAIVFVAFWLVAMGLVGILLSSDALRVAPAVLTILCGFDLVYAGLEGNLAIAGFFAALTLLAALAFAYLAAVQGFGPGPAASNEEGTDG